MWLHPRLHPCPGDGSDADTVKKRLDLLESTFNEMRALQEDLKELYDFVATLFDYTDETASATTVEQFKDALINTCSVERRNDQGESLVYCTLTHELLPQQARKSRRGRTCLGSLPSFTDPGRGRPRWGAGCDSRTYLEARLAHVLKEVHGVRDP